MRLRPMPRELRIAYTPDSDDVFAYSGWEHGHVSLATADYHPVFSRDHITALNRQAQDEAFDVVAVSAAFFPHVADRYWILSAGSSIGRACGPVLVSAEPLGLEALSGATIAVAGEQTTGGMLARFYAPGARFVSTPYDAIGEAVASGEADAGVMIHEEIFYFGQTGLQLVADLGKVWYEDTGLPLPVGLNLVRRALGEALAAEIADVCLASLAWAHAHEDEAMAVASRFGRGLARAHVGMFRREDTLALADDVRLGLRAMFDRMAELGVAPRVDDFRVIEARHSPLARGMA